MSRSSAQRSANKSWELFRYRKINDFLWEELERSAIFCPEPETFNDPFDCRVDWRSAIQRALGTKEISLQRQAKLETMLEAFSDRDPHLECGVGCFTRDVRSLLMWSHYAASHTGVCLLYNFPSGYFRERYQARGNAMYFVGGSKVTYGDNAFTHWLAKGDLDQPLRGQVVENAVCAMFMSKAKKWDYEEEWRVVTSQAAPLAFEPAFLTNITFGMRTPEATRRRIAEVARSRNPAVTFREAIKDRAADFAIAVRDLAI